MKIGDTILIKIRENKGNGAKDIYAEGILNGITSEFGHKTYIVSNAKIVGDIKTRKLLTKVEIRKGKELIK